MAATPSDAHAAVLLLRSELPGTLEATIPKIVFQHQVYTIVSNRTLADRQLEQLRREKIIRVFKLGSQADEMAIMLRQDYDTHVRGVVPDKALATAFLKVIEDEQAVSITKAELVTSGDFSPSALSQLIQSCCVTMRDARSLWISIPNAGSFMRSLRKGRDALKRIVKNSKFREALERDVLKRKLKGTKLGMRYHMSDAIGAGALVSTKTTMGPLLRLPDPD